MKKGFFDFFTVDESAIGRSEVADKKTILIGKNLRMRTADGGVLDLKRIFRESADGGGFLREVVDARKILSLAIWVWA